MRQSLSLEHSADAWLKESNCLISCVVLLLLISNPNYICCNGCFAGIVFNVLDHISICNMVGLACMVKNHSLTPFCRISDTKSSTMYSFEKVCKTS